MTSPNPVLQEASLPAATITDSDPEEKDADLLYTNESLLPQVDWDKLEKQLKRAQVERDRYDKVCGIRRRCIYHLASSRQRLRELAARLFKAQASIRFRKSVHFRWCGNGVKDIVLTYRFSSPCRKQRHGWLGFEMKAKHRRSNSRPWSCNTQLFRSRLLLLLLLSLLYDRSRTDADPFH